LLGRIGVEEPAEPLAGADPKVMVALRANEEIALELGAVELSGTARALHPQAFRHRAPPLLGVDAGRHQLVEPAHFRSSSRTRAFAGRAIIAQLPFQGQSPFTQSRRNRSRRVTDVRSPRPRKRGLTPKKLHLEPNGQTGGQASLGATGGIA